MEPEPAEEVMDEEGDGSPPAGWTYEIPDDTEEELAEASIQLGLLAIRRINEDDPWY